MGQLFRRQVLEQRQQRLSGEVSLIQPPVFKTLGLSKDHSDQEWITAMVSNPILIERPVIISQNGAVIGRPPENVHLLLD